MGWRFDERLEVVGQVRDDFRPRLAVLAHVVVHFDLFDPLLLLLVQFRQVRYVLLREFQDFVQFVAESVLGVVAGTGVWAHAGAVCFGAAVGRLLRGYLIYVFLSRQLAKQKRWHSFELFQLAYVEGLSLIFLRVAFGNIELNFVVIHSGGATRSNGKDLAFLERWTFSTSC